MQYIAVLWHHQSPVDPSELDAARWEQRKIKVFEDGGCDFANEQRRGGSELGSVPVPPLAEIVSDAQFTLREISREEFEAVWGEYPGHGLITRSTEQRLAVGPFLHSEFGCPQCAGSRLANDSAMGTVCRRRFRKKLISW